MIEVHHFLEFLFLQIILICGGIYILIEAFLIVTHLGWKLLSNYHKVVKINNLSYCIRKTYWDQIENYDKEVSVLICIDLGQGFSQKLLQRRPYPNTDMTKSILTEE